MQYLAISTPAEARSSPDYKVKTTVCVLNNLSSM